MPDDAGKQGRDEIDRWCREAEDNPPTPFAENEIIEAPAPVSVNAVGIPGGALVRFRTRDGEEETLFLNAAVSAQLIAAVMDAGMRAEWLADGLDTVIELLRDGGKPPRPH